MKSLLIINLIAERRYSLLFNFFQHYLFAIQNLAAEERPPQSGFFNDTKIERN